MRMIDADVLENSLGAENEDGYVRELLKDAPTVPAVPLDKLCEWLAGYAEPPLDALTICDNEYEAWKMTLTKWMEGLDAAD